jgi:sugar phosphate isomerase/epimerase
MMLLGISTLGHLIDNISKNKINNNLFDMFFKATESCFNFAEENDIDVVEIVIDPQSIIRGENKQKFIDLVNSYSLEKQVHGPYIDINLSAHNDTISAASVDSYLETYKLCQEISVKLMTIHPGQANGMNPSLNEYNKLQLAGAISRLLDTINNPEFTICLENMPRSTFIMLDQNDIELVLKKINRSDLKMTYDTSHFYTNNGNVEILWEKYHEIIKNVHLVENYTVLSDTHPTLGTGKINFKAIFNQLEKFQYEGSLIIELASSESLQRSIHFIYQFF